MKRLSALLGLLALATQVALAVVTPNKTDIVDYCTGANNSNCVVQVDSSGNLTANSITAQGVMVPVAKTLAQMNLLAPTAANQVIIVSDAVQSRVCVSSGTGAGAWVVSSATGTFVGGSYPHCN